MNLYLVTYTSFDGDNYDSFISALTPEQAVEIWRTVSQLDEGPEYVFRVPQVATHARRHMWHEDKDVACVWEQT